MHCVYEYPSLHAYLRDCLAPGEHGTVTWHGIGVFGSVEIRRRHGRIEYVSCRYPAIQRCAKAVGYLSLVVRVFDHRVYHTRTGRQVPMNRVYSSVWKDGAQVCTLSPDDCLAMNLVDGRPEPGVMYL